MTVPVVKTFLIKRNARKPFLRLLVKDEDGNAFDFSGAVDTTFLMYLDGVEKVNAAGVLESPLTTGVLRYEWAAGDTDTEGEFQAEFEVNYGSGVKMTIPLDGHLAVRIHPDLDNV